MEVPGGSKNKGLVLLCELFGTMFLMMAINWSSVSDATPQCAAMTITILIQLFG